MTEAAPEGEFLAESAKNAAPDLWLPVPSRAQHDDPITQETWERRERARREAEAAITKAFSTATVRR